MTSPHYRPRDMRVKFLGSIAAEAARVRGATAMDVAKANIDASCGTAALVNRLKLRVERLMLFGPEHEGVRARFGARAEMLRGATLNEACHRVHHWYLNERGGMQKASAISSGTSMSYIVLQELDLILRWMRAAGLACQFQTFVYDVMGG